MSTTNILLLSLPKEVITMEILSRLPVKYILRFRSVCKTFLELFCDLGKDEEFVRLQLNNALSNNYLNIMLTGNNQIYSVDYFDASSCKINAIEIDYPFKSHLTKDVQIWGSCNGLLCLGIKNMEEDECICFWNPSTDEYKRIPPSPPPSPTTSEFRSSGYAILYGYESYGLGYDCANDDYKLVRLLFEVKTAVSRSGNNSEAHVYTLGTNSWKSIGKIPCRHPFYNKSGIYLNGCLHWVGDSHTDIIDCFRLNEERFEELLLPRDFDHDIRFKELSVLKGCLCLVGNRFQPLKCSRSDIWVMTEYGVRESWTKILTINHDGIDKRSSSIQVLMPCNNGEILSLSTISSVFNTFDGRIEMNRKLLSCFVLHDQKKEGISYCRSITITKGIIPKAFEADTFMETLVSLKSGTYLTGDYKQLVKRQRRT